MRLFFKLSLRSVLTCAASLLFLLVSFWTSEIQAQTLPVFTDGNLSVEVTLRNPCNTPSLNNGSIEFRIISSEGSVPVNIFRFLPSGTFLNIAVGSTFVFPVSFPPTGVSSGTYRFVIDDGTNAIDLFSAPLNLTNSSPITDNGSSKTDNVVCGATAGTIDVEVTGGSGNYAYSWNDGATTQDRSGLATGTYSVVVSDAATNCTLTLNFNIGDPQPLDFQIAAASSAVC
ncbi:MAG: hypothetical protein EBU52_16045, partial [Cytophagia bacterium]|nr:hypothetical protein [Cytophagia bacterium]